MEGFFAIYRVRISPRDQPLREAKQRQLSEGLLQLIAHQNPSPSPSTVPVPMAVPKGVQVGVYFIMHLSILNVKRRDSASQLVN